MPTSRRASVARFAAIGPRAARGRRRAPALVRPPYQLHLTARRVAASPGADGEPELTLDGIDFCRVLSDRTAHHPVTHDLLDVAVPV